MCNELKPFLYVAIFVSAAIALYELMNFSSAGFVLFLLAGISAFYGYFLLLCCGAKKKR
jgi:hypothetical protein